MYFVFKSLFWRFFLIIMIITFNKLGASYPIEVTIVHSINKRNVPGATFKFFKNCSADRIFFPSHRLRQTC